MSETRSGWYDDPDDPDQLRYWDGILWTERRMPKVKPGLDGSHIGTPSAYDEPAEGVDEPSVEGSAPRPPSNPSDPYATHSTTPQQPWQQTPQQQAQRTGPFTPDGQRISGWWRRFAAWVIDSLIVGLAAAVVAYPWMSEWVSSYQEYFDDVMSASRNGESLPDMPDSVVSLPATWLVAMLVVYAIYEIAFLVTRGRTPGKMVTGTSVRPMHEARTLTFDEALRRFGVKGIATILNPIPLLSGVGTLFTIVDGLWPIGDADNQSIHDKIARTVVVVGRSTGAQPQPPADRLPGV